MRVGIEIGGTFTDLVALGEDGIVTRTIKVLSTPSAPEQAVFAALDQLVHGSTASGGSGQPADPGPIEALVHGSTVATNAVLERKGAPTGLIVTRGCGDVLEIQRHEKADMFDVRYGKPQPLVPRDRVGEVDERLDAGGSVVVPLDESQGVEVARRLSAAGVQSLTVCLLHSYANPLHEVRLRAVIEEALPDLPVTLSSEVLPQFREYERASTTVMNAYVKPVIDRYIGRIEDRMQDYAIPRLWIMQSNGGVLPAAMARQHAARTLLSGPAAGVTGATYLAKQAGFPNIMTLDMGGTSTDVCLVQDNQPVVSAECKIDGLPLSIPMIDIATVGAGGGSIAWIDEGRMLHVGPQSAGADPGPAAYGRGGTTATVTDAHVVLGLIRPKNFLGGRMRLDATAAEAAVGRLADSLGMSRESAAEGIVQVATATMAGAMRLVSLERGHDPRDFTLLAFGGAGPLHAARLADELDIPRVLVPPHPGLLSAYGLLAADLTRDYVRTHVTRLRETGPGPVRDQFVMLQEMAQAELSRFHLDANTALQITRQVDVRYVGQGYELTVTVTSVESPDLCDQIVQSFHAAHEVRYGHASLRQAVEIVNYRLLLTISQLRPGRPSVRPERGAARSVERSVTIDGARHACQFLWRDDLAVGSRVAGPTVIEEETATCWIPPCWRATVDAAANIVLERQQ